MTFFIKIKNFFKWILLNKKSKEQINKYLYLFILNIAQLKLLNIIILIIIHDSIDPIFVSVDLCKNIGVTYSTLKAARCNTHDVVFNDQRTTAITLKIY
jgi:hypothetical protein